MKMLNLFCFKQYVCGQMTELGEIKWRRGKMQLLCVGANFGLKKKKKIYGTIQKVEIEVVVIDWRSVDECPYLF